MDTLHKTIYVPLAKIDKEKRMVYGFASTPDVDSDGEIIELEAIKRALPDYMQFPTLREMHQAKAVGTVKSGEIKEDDGKKGLYIGAKVVSNEAWELVKEGVYRGFSIGGDVIRRVGNVIKELNLVEISLVDVPANKAAKIEVWKGSKDMDITKDASGISSLTSLMNHCRDCIYMMEYNKKDASKLKKILEDIKKLIGKEAAEAEPVKTDNNMLMLSREPQEIIKTLDSLNFGDNKMAQALAKGVSLAMAKELDELKKAENTEETKVEETTTTTEESTKTDDVEVETTETTPEEKTENKEASDDVTLTKVDSAIATIDSINKGKESEDLIKANEGLTKSVAKMADAIVKMADQMKSFNERLTAVENTPAATKSKSVAVFKGDEHKKEVENTTTVNADTTVAKSIAEKQARLLEIKKQRETMTPNEFVKSGLSKEAANLYSQLDELNKRQ